MICDVHNKYLKPLLLKIAVFGFFVPLTILAAEFNDQQVKAALIYNFIKHVTWPNESKKISFTVGVYKDSEFSLLLANAVKNRQVKGKQLIVSDINSAEQAKSFDVVFFPLKYNAEFSSFTNTIRSSKTLVISEQSGEPQNVMINLLVQQETGLFSFEVNKSNIIYEGLQSSKELLLLGGTELDVAILYRETEAAMFATKKREEALNVKLRAQQSQLNDAIKQFNDLKSNHQIELNKQQTELSQVKSILKQQQQSLQENKLALANTLISLEKAEKLREDAINELSQQRIALEEKEQENRQTIKQVTKNKQTLQQQQKEISNQETKLAEQALALQQSSQTIDTQRTTIFHISVLIILAVLVSVLIIILFIKNKRTTRKLSTALTNLELSQEKLVESEKMVALGGLVAGVAHEINTPIGVCVTASSCLSDAVKKLSADFETNNISRANLTSFINESQSSSKILESNLQRAAELIQSFKRVAVEQSSDDLHQFNLHDMLMDIVKSQQLTFKQYDVTINVACSPDIQLNSYPGIITQIISNLIDNAFVHAFDKDIQAGLININVTPIAEGYLIHFEDNGKGINKEELTKIFDPFYTTKRHKGGTGLGLNIVYNLIIKGLLSEFNYDSTPGQGTWFEFTLKNLSS